MPRRNVRFWSKLGIRNATWEVRFTPVRGHRQAVSTCPKSAMNRLMHRRKQQLYSMRARIQGRTVGKLSATLKLRNTICQKPTYPRREIAGQFGGQAARTRRLLIEPEPITYLHAQALLGEALKNSGENLASANLVNWLAILFGIDRRGSSHGFTTNQAERKLVVSLASDDRPALKVVMITLAGDPTVPDLRLPTYSAGGNVCDVVEPGLISDPDDCFFPGYEPFIGPTSGLLNADQAANRQHQEIVPSPKHVERPALLDQVRIIEWQTPW